VKAGIREHRNCLTSVEAYRRHFVG
jgi:hypothetical protein